MAETFHEVPLVVAMCHEGMSHTIKGYQRHRLDPPRFFQAKRRNGGFLVVIIGRVPLAPDAVKRWYLSLSTSPTPIPNHQAGERPTDAEYWEACRQIKPEVTFEIYNGGMPMCVHGFEK